MMPIFRFAPLALLGVATVSLAQAGPGGPSGLGGGQVVGGQLGSMPQGSSTSDGTTSTDLSQRSMGLKRVPGAPRKDAAQPAVAADLIAGATLADPKGLDIGYIKSVDPDGVVVATTGGQVKVPAEAFGKNKKGLLIGMSKADFDKLVAQAVGG